MRRLILLPLAALASLPVAGFAAPPAPASAAKPAFASDRISVEVKGSGPDVVLIPGLSSSPRVWDSTVAALPGYRYHLIRVAGFDGTKPGANASGPVVAPVGEEIARYVREAGLKKPAVVGHSLGGTWAMMVAGRHPDLVSKVMVVDMMPFLGAMFGGPAATPETLAPIAEQVRKGIATTAGETRRKQIEQTIGGMVKTESLRAATIEQSLASDPAVSGQAMADLIVTDLRPDLAKIKGPMTVLWVVPPGAPVTDAQMEQFYKLSYAGAPQAVIKRIPDSYHFIMYDQPALFQSELKAFLAR
jgi:pimeloyl-ACP methyl ester carboxylesterase